MHDLKNPLTVIASNATYVLETANINNDQSEALRDVLSAANRMQAMLLDLLDIGRATLGDAKMIPRKEQIDVAKLVKSIVGRGIDHTTRVKVVTDIEPRMAVRADPALLGRLLANLIDNAQRHAPQNSTVIVSAHRRLGGILLAVADTGDGIDDDNKRRVFDVYVRLDAGNARTGHGLDRRTVRQRREAS